MNLLEIARSIFFLFILLSSCEIDVMSCPTIFWVLLASAWTIGFFINLFDEFCKLWIKSAIPPESGRTLIATILNSVMQFNVSRIWTTIWSNDVWSFPAGNRTWHDGTDEYAIIVRFDGSVVQAN